MRKLQHGKICELLGTLQEAADILSEMGNADARGRLVSDMLFFVDEITRYVEGIANTSQLVSALEALGGTLSSMIESREQTCSACCDRGADCGNVLERLDDVKKGLDAIEIERTSAEVFWAEADFSRYIDLLRQAEEDGYSIIITSRDTPCGSSRFTEEMGERLRTLGLDINLWNKWRVSYCAVIDEGRKVDEKISDTHSVSIRCKLGKADVLVKSAGMQKVDSPRMCSVMIDGKERRIGNRGLFFVIYDKENDVVVDSSNFDTYSEDLVASHLGMRSALREFVEGVPGVVFLNARFPEFPEEHLSKNEKWILKEQIHYTKFYQDPMLSPVLTKHIKEPTGVLEVLTPPKSYVGVDGARRFEDYKGKYLNIVDGHRKTLWQPEKFKRTIYIVGGCIWLGIGVRDEGTLASQLQKLLNIYAPGESFLVENYGFALDGMDWQKEILAILKALPLKSGDIVIGAGGRVTSYNKELDVRPYRHGELFYDDMHVTEEAHGLVAEGLLDTLREHDFFRESLSEKQPPHQICKENYNLAEAQLAELEAYKKKLEKIYSEYSKPKELVGAIVMNCNPFTLGHRYLIETCAKKCDMLIVFVVQEDKSFFSFEDRIRLVRAGCEGLENVRVVESGKFVLSSLTFSEYFNKSQLQDRVVDSSQDVTLFANEIAPAANIRVRFVGTEPLDTVTRQYNRTLEMILSRHGIGFEEIPRLKKDGNVISASRVREALENGDWETIRKLVPDTTFSYLTEKYQRHLQVEINEETLQDIINIETGLLYPLDGFMREKDFRSVIDRYTMADGEVFTIPVTLDVPQAVYEELAAPETLDLLFRGEAVASIDVEDKYEMTDADIKKVFGTLEDAHPGVKKEHERNPYRVGGRTRLSKRELLDGALKPEETKRIFKEKGWKTVVGFQTRNPIHKAHEHIQRLGLEVCDGLFINPITGWKKKGDFTEEAVVAAYEAMMKEFYPSERVYMAGLKTQMRYAGPREAIFHAIIRRNLGCTHFTIGRDHAGVCGYYGAYDAHELARKLMAEHDLGIELLLTREPYYCTKCKQVVTDNTCGHYNTNRVEISGTIIRKYIGEGRIPDEVMMRQEIFDAILKCEKVFIE